jgi:hypothetical protein
MSATNEALAIGLHHLQADGTSPFSRAVLTEMYRLYALADECPPCPLTDAQNVAYAGYSTSAVVYPPGTTLATGESCPRIGPDDGPDAMEDI